LKEVCIVTDKFSNEGRFVLGTSPEWKDKKNCELIKFDIEGVCRTFIIAT
jgi:hypothetical protein